MKENHYIHLLKHRSFLSFWSATTLLRLASNVLQFALAIYVLDLTGSAFVYSTVLAIILLPRILCTPIAGSLADLHDSIGILRWSALGLVGLMGCFWAVHGLVLPLNVPMIYALVICLELCETFLAPAEGKALPCIVTEEELAPATKLSSLDDGVVELLSPVLAALFYGPMGLSGVLGITFAMEGAAFLLTTQIRSASVPVPDVTAEAPKFSLKDTCRTYRDAVVSLKSYPYVIGIILFAPLFNFFISPLFSVTAPHYFRVTMQADVNQYAMFNMALGIAGLIAPFFAMVFIRDEDERRANLGGTLASALLLLGLTVVVHFSASHFLPYLFTGTMALLTAIITIMNIATSITMKKRIPTEMMGRVISMIQLCATISVPLGQLFYGLCTDHFPVTVSLLLSVAGLMVTLAVMIQTYRLIRTH